MAVLATNCGVPISVLDYVELNGEPNRPSMSLATPFEVLR